MARRAPGAAGLLELRKLVLTLSHRRTLAQTFAAIAATSPSFYLAPELGDARVLVSLASFLPSLAICLVPRICDRHCHRLRASCFGDHDGTAAATVPAPTPIGHGSLLGRQPSKQAHAVCPVALDHPAPRPAQCRHSLARVSAMQLVLPKFSNALSLPERPLPSAIVACAILR
jgi:hypothetical protein